LPHIPQRWDNLTNKLLDFPLVHNVLSRHLQCETEKLEKLFGDNRAESHAFQAVLAGLLVGLEALLGKLLEQLHIFKLTVLLLKINASLENQKSDWPTVLQQSQRCLIGGFSR